MIIIKFILMYIAVSIAYLFINAMLITVLGKDDGGIISLTLTTLAITILLMGAL